jgi:hypothetical protein
VTLNVVKKIESSEMTRKTPRSLEEAIENLSIYKEVAFVHMGKVNNPDILVIMADLFLKLAEVSWCVVSGSFGRNPVIIMQYVGFRQDAGKTAEKLFGKWGTAGGHKGAARAEVPLVKVRELHPRATQPERRFVLSRIHREWQRYVRISVLSSSNLSFRALLARPWIDERRGFPLRLERTWRVSSTSGRPTAPK